jgi:hypothetical protein
MHNHHMIDGVKVPFTPEEEEAWEAARVSWEAGANDRALSKLRIKRNELLKASDWRASSDLTMSDEWKAYRQSLRDLPATTADPANPTWPDKPE